MNDSTPPVSDDSTPLNSTTKKIRFSPKLVPTVGCVIAVSVLMSLCVWQIFRHFERNVHVEIMEKNKGLDTLNTLPDVTALDDLLYRRFSLRGRFIGPRLLEAGRVLKRHSGYAVFQIFVTENGRRILVDRGDVILAEMRETVLSLSDAPRASIQGQMIPILRDDIGPPVNKDPPLVWRRQSISKIHHWASQAHPKQAPTPKVYLRLGAEYEVGKGPLQSPESTLATGYLKARINWDSAHYAVQWFGIAGIIFGFWVWVSFGRPWSD
jgi:cytochrome oxidase assembly protein ShyY1